jgi:hypothetical protein
MTEDHAHERIRRIIDGLVGMMIQHRLPAVDLQDERTVFMIPPPRAAVGMGEASGPDALAVAVKLALRDLGKAIRRARGDEP